MFGFGLTRRRGSSVWQVRKRYPTDVSAILKGEFTRSTGEADRKLAEARLPGIATEYQARVDEARRRLADVRFRDLSENEINRLAARFYTEMLPRYRLTRALSPVERAQMLQDAQGTLQTLKGNLGSNDPGPVAAVTRRLIKQEGLPISEDSPSFATLQLMILRAFVELHKGVVAQLHGELEFRPTDEGIAKLLDKQGQPTKTIEDLLTAYREEKEERWSPSAKEAFRPVERLLKDIIGTRETSSVSREDAREIQQLIRYLPRNLGKLKQLKGLTVRQAVEIGRKLSLPTINPNTVNRGYLVHLSALFNWARREQWTTANPFEGLAVHDPVAPEDKRDPFTTEQLRSIFEGKRWSSAKTEKPLRYWGPLLALFLGMRRGEIAQLLTSDVEQAEGAWVIQIRPGGEKRLKTNSARRTLPLHPELVRLGFLQFIKGRRRDDDPQLFPGEQPNGRGQWGDGFSDWFSRLLRAQDISGRMLGMHSFRHNWQDRLRAANLHGTAIGQQLAGRSTRGDVSSQYGKGGDGFPVSMLVEAVEGITYPDLDLSHLYVSEVAEAA